MAYTIHRVKLHFFIEGSLPRRVSFTCFQNERNQMKPNEEAATNIILNSVKFHVSSGFISV